MRELYNPANHSGRKAFRSVSGHAVKRVLLIFLIAAAAAASYPRTVIAADGSETVTLQLEAVCHQNEARSMLALVNAFRQNAEEAWVWNSTDTQKEYREGLKAYVYDYELEKIAIQRAVEIAVSFSHTRPNGKYFNTCYFSADHITRGENVAVGYKSAAAVFQDWQETDKKYASQGHRRNLLHKKFTRVGIAYVTVDGVSCWAQEFYDGDAAASGPYAAEEGTRKVSVETDPSLIKAITLYNGSDKSISIGIGETAVLNGLKARVTLPYPYQPGFRILTLKNSFSLSIADTQIAGISGGKLVGKKTGSTSLKGTLLGRTVSIPVNVSAADLKDASVTTERAVYTGKAVKTTLAVTCDGKTLKEGTDYKTSYSNNIKTGTAKVKIKGIGNYTGTRTATFRIERYSLEEGTVLQETKYKGIYKVTKAGFSKEAEVAFAGCHVDVPVSLSVPATVKSGGVTYKVTSIAKYALKDVTSLKKLTVGKEVVRIGAGAFSGCTNLTSIQIRTTHLTSGKIGKNAFRGIPKKAVVRVPEGLADTYRSIFRKKGLAKKAKVK